MKSKKVIHMIKHTPTGAVVPVTIKNVNKENIITEFKEVSDKRKFFTLEMLQERWNKKREDVLSILKKYQVPAHLDHLDLKKLNDNQMPVDVAVFFEEYILGLEYKGKIKHNKLKSKKI